MVRKITDMKIGQGDIASVLPDRKDLLFFASGVSNSQCINEKEYQREIDLLLDQRRDLRIVYFSSLAIFYSKTRYTQHKRDMEAMIKENFPKYCIVRLGNISWGTNPHTLINYLRNRIETGKKVEIQDVYRYVIDEKDFLYWINLIPDFNVEMNCPGRMMKVQEIVKKLRREHEK